MKNYALAITVACLSVLSAVPSHAQLLVTNPGFEDGNDGTADSGSLNGWSGLFGSGTTAALPGGDTTSATITTDPSNFSGIAQTIGTANITGLQTINFQLALDSGNLPVSNPATNDGSILFRMEDATASTVQDFYIQSNQLSSTAYTNFAETFNVTSGDLYRMDFYGFTTGSGATPGTYLVDNVTMTVPEPSTYALMLSGGLMLLFGRRLFRREESL